jgi:hypothetical protein
MRGVDMKVTKGNISKALIKAHMKSQLLAVEEFVQA